LHSRDASIGARQVTDMNDFNRAIIDEFRANGGKVGGQFAGAPLLLLTTTGARSGEPRTTPVMYRSEGDRVVVFASKAGAPTNPAWFHNMLANPTVTVELGDESFQATAVVTEGAERDELFQRQAQAFPQLAEYASQAERKIPVVALERNG
jgi:deazaflavin-dependent oxidoreductase (nitroreductase family)